MVQHERMCCRACLRPVCIGVSLGYTTTPPLPCESSCWCSSFVIPRCSVGQEEAKSSVEIKQVAVKSVDSNIALIRASKEVCSRPVWPLYLAQHRICVITNFTPWAQQSPSAVLLAQREFAAPGECVTHLWRRLDVHALSC